MVKECSERSLGVELRVQLKAARRAKPWDAADLSLVAAARSQDVEVPRFLVKGIAC